MSGGKERICKRCNGTGQMCINCNKSEAKCNCRLQLAKDENGDDIEAEVEVEYIDCGMCDGKGSVAA